MVSEEEPGEGLQSKNVYHQKTEKYRGMQVNCLVK